MNVQGNPRSRVTFLRDSRADTHYVVLPVEGSGRYATNDYDLLSMLQLAGEFTLGADLSEVRFWTTQSKRDRPIICFVALGDEVGQENELVNSLTRANAAIFSQLSDDGLCQVLVPLITMHDKFFDERECFSAIVQSIINGQFVVFPNIELMIVVPKEISESELYVFREKVDRTLGNTPMEDTEENPDQTKSAMGPVSSSVAADLTDEPSPQEDLLLNIDDDVRSLLAAASILSPGAKNSSNTITSTSLLFALGSFDQTEIPFKNSQPASIFSTALKNLAGNLYASTWKSYFKAKFNYALPRDLRDVTILPPSRNVEEVLQAAIVRAIEAGRDKAELNDVILALLGKEAKYRERLGMMRVAPNALLERYASKKKPSAKFTADPWNDTSGETADDYLDIENEVNAFAELLAGKSTSPPLSIGIFGEWGSGKSFFMERVYQAVHGPKGLCNSEDEAFHRHIVPIRFNAWHYIETNLWASLVEHIFRELDLWLNANGKGSEKLFEQLVTSKQLRYDAVCALRNHLLDVKKAVEKLQEAEKKQESAKQGQRQATGADLWNAGVKIFSEQLTPADRAQIKELQSSLGMTEVSNSVASFADMLKEGKSKSNQAQTLLKSLMIKMGSGTRVALLIGALLAIPFAVELARVALKRIANTDLSEFGSMLFAAASMISVLTLQGKTLIDHGVKCMAVIGKFNAKLDQSLQSAADKQREAISAVEIELETAKKGLHDAEAHLSEMTALAKSAEKEFVNESARGRLNRFIREKVADGVYAKHLSLIATIRKDFGQLTDIMNGDGELSMSATSHALMSDQELLQKKINIVTDEIRKISSDCDLLAEDTLSGLEGVQEPPPKSFERIVLYIDDLDRCPPRQVVEVIQAIHLLLYFKLFIVVVAVDARWLARSLEREFPDLMVVPKSNGPAGGNGSDALKTSAEGEAAIKRKAAGGRRNREADVKAAGRDWHEEAAEPGAEIRMDWQAAARATPLDYIEKIFQIPFWVRPMDKTLCQQFVENLVQSKLENRGAPVPIVAEGATRTPVPIPAPVPGPAPVSVSVPVSVPDAAPGVSEGGRTEVPISQQPGGGAVSENTIAPVAGQDGSALPGQGKPSNEPSGAEVIPTPPDQAKREKMTFTVYESRVLAEFSPYFVTSPRRAKRILNIYLLLKKALYDSRELFIHGSVESRLICPAIATLLALVDGPPDTRGDFYRALDDGRNHDLNVAQLADRIPRNATPSRVAVHDVLRQLVLVCESENVATDKRMVSTLRMLAPTVRRYSFDCRI